MSYRPPRNNFHAPRRGELSLDEEELLTADEDLEQLELHRAYRRRGSRGFERQLRSMRRAGIVIGILGAFFPTVMFIFGFFEDPTAGKAIAIIAIPTVLIGGSLILCEILTRVVHWIDGD